MAPKRMAVTKEAAAPQNPPAAAPPPKPRMARKGTPGNLELRVGMNTFYASGKSGGEDVYRAIDSYAQFVKVHPNPTLPAFQAWFQGEAAKRFGEGYSQRLHARGREVVIDAHRQFLLYNSGVDRKREPSHVELERRGYAIVRHLK